MTSSSTYLWLSLLFLFDVTTTTVRTFQVKTDEHRFRCGQRPINGIGVITAGKSTFPGEFPWHAAIYRMRQLGSEYICGGFLISDRIVVTAAHCVTAPNGFQLVPGVITVRLGLYELAAMNRNTQEHRVEKILRHDNYTYGLFRHDLAILFLRTIVEFSDYVQPICLWDVELFGEGEKLVGVVSGWGLTEYDMLANELKSARLPMVSYPDCLESDRDLFSAMIFDGMFCAGLTNSTNVCNGDSGGAFAVNINGTWVARGIISFTGLKDSSITLCNPNSLAGFVNIPRYLTWIERVANIDRFEPIEVAVDNTVDISSVPTNNSTVTPMTETSDRISEKKCLEYRSESKGSVQELSYLAYVSRSSPFMRVIDCFAVLISERFLLSTADCRSTPPPPPPSRSQSEQFIIVETEGQALHYNIENFHQHPHFVRSPAENNLALIELERSVSIPSNQFVCLWSREHFDLGKTFLYSATNSAAAGGKPAPPKDSAKCFNQLLAPSIMLEDDKRGFYHLVGIVVNSTCSKIRFIKVHKFVPWIEDVVWNNIK